METEDEEVRAAGRTYRTVCPLPPPMSPRRLLAVLTPFLGGWGRRGWGGGGSSLSVLWRKHVASTA